MYQIKQYPEDFVVKEISDIKPKDSGKYAIVILKKTNYNTLRAIGHIAQSLCIQPKDVGFAGTKDKIAVTEQYISIKNAKKEDIGKIRLKDIELSFRGYSDTPISLGELKENEFIITIRGLTAKEILALQKKIKKKVLMPNYFGEQRFSDYNVEIGKNLVKCNFEQALKLILESNPDNKEKIQCFVKDKPRDHVGALKLLPKKLLTLYVHAYQGYIWNETLKEYVKKSKKNIKIPVVGFGTEITDKEVGNIVERIMKKENITNRTFINRPIPELSFEGSSRAAFVEARDLEILETGKDFVKLKFRLDKGSYATVAIEFLLG